jgi:hypothetical protein
MTKSAQAWYWLAAGVLALGLNGVYHDGGVRWAHRAADRFLDRSQAFAELAPARVQSIVERVRMAVSGHNEENERVACRWSARLQSQVARAQSEADRMQAMTDRQSARLDATRERMEARFSNAHFVTVASPACSRVRVNIPQIDVPQIDIPEVEIPKIAVGPINIPRINVSQISIPRINVPQISVRAISVPRIKISQPVVVSPEIRIDTGDQGPI